MKTLIVTLMLIFITSCSIDSEESKEVRDLTHLLNFPPELSHCKWLHVPYVDGHGGKTIIYCPGSSMTSTSRGKFGDTTIISQD